MAQTSGSYIVLQSWWIRLPLAARHLSDNLAATLTDGLYLTAWPRLAAVAPPLAALTGLLVGWLHPGFSEVFSESLPIMMLAAGLGIMSGHLGMLFLTGFILGDFFLAHTVWTQEGSLWQHVLRVRLPLVIEYSLLALLTTGIPVWTKGLLALLPLPRGRPRRVYVRLALLGHATLTCGLVYYWAHVVPVLIRPVFTWRGLEVPLDALAPLQQQALLLIAVALLASLLRMALQGVTLRSARYSTRLEAWQRRIVAAPLVRSIMKRLPLFVRVTGRTSWAVLLLGGILQNWVEGLLLALLFFFVRVLGEGLLPLPLDRWRELVAKLPWPVRVGTALVLFYLVSLVLLAWRMPFVVITGFALLLFFLLVPGQSATPSLNTKETS